MDTRSYFKDLQVRQTPRNGDSWARGVLTSHFSQIWTDAPILDSLSSSSTLSKDIRWLAVSSVAVAAALLGAYA